MPLLAAGADAGDAPKDGWSEDLLSRLIAAPEGAPSEGRTAQDGWVMRSYQLRNLHIGDAGRATNLVSILRRMLPPDSRVTEDRASNALHVFSTSSAQDGALEFISAMDTAEGPASPRTEPATIPDEVRKALETLAASNPDADKLTKLLLETSQRMESRVGEVVRRAESESQVQLRNWLFVGGGAFAFTLVVGGVAISVYLKRAQQRHIVEAAKKESASLALLPTQSMEVLMSASREQQDRARELQKLMESFTIAYQADRQRSTLVMEAVARKHSELAATVDQMQQLRREIGENAGRMFLEVNRDALDQIVQRAADALKSRADEVGLIAETASRKMDETANRLEVQHARAEALANELERTQKEVDALFEKLRGAQDEVRQAQYEANEQRRIATEKSVELAKKEAALAGLSLLMQEPMSEILDTLNSAEQPPPEGYSDPSLPNVVDFPADEELGDPSLPVSEDVPPLSHTSPTSAPPCPTTPPYTFHITAAS